MNSERAREPGEHETLPTLGTLLEELRAAGITPLAEHEVRSQLESLPTGVPAILTRDFACGLRASRQRDGSYIVSTTNGLEDPDHPVSKQFRFRRFAL